MNEESNFVEEYIQHLESLLDSYILYIQELEKYVPQNLLRRKG